MYYFEKALISLKKGNKEDYKINIINGINNCEPYAYYLGYNYPIAIDMDKYNEILDENNDFSKAAKGKMMMLDGNLDGLELLKESNTGIAKYELYKYYSELDDIKNAKIYLDEAIKFEFSLAYYEYAFDLKINGSLTRFEMNGEKFFDMCDKAISYGFFDGYYAKAKLYEEGFYIAKDVNKAIELYKQLPDSEYAYRNIYLIRDYYELEDYDNAYKLCIEYIEREEMLKAIASHYLSKIYEKKDSKYYNLIKSLIYKKSLVTSIQSETYIIEIAKIYYDLGNKYMASEYIRLFNQLIEYNDTCISLFDNYDDLIYELEEFNGKKDKTNYYKLVYKFKNEGNDKETYEASLNGFLCDQKDCYNLLANFYNKGIVVEKDLNIVKVLAKASKNVLIFRKKTDVEI